MPLPVPLSLEELEAVAATHGTPFQLYDEGAIRANIRELLAAFGGKFEGFQQFFAVKALPNPAILQLLLSEGCGMDCSSTSELFVCKALGVPGEKIMYTSNYTSKQDLTMALELGANLNLDDITLVDDLVAAAAASGGSFPEMISFRLNPGLGRTDSETKSNVLGGPDAKVLLLLLLLLVVVLVVALLLALALALALPLLLLLLLILSQTVRRATDGHHRGVQEGAGGGSHALRYMLIMIPAVHS